MSLTRQKATDRRHARLKYASPRMPKRWRDLRYQRMRAFLAPSDGWYRVVMLGTRGAASRRGTIVSWKYREQRGSRSRPGGAVGVRGHCFELRARGRCRHTHTFPSFDRESERPGWSPHQQTALCACPRRHHEARLTTGVLVTSEVRAASVRNTTNTTGRPSDRSVRSKQSGPERGVEVRVRWTADSSLSLSVGSAAEACTRSAHKTERNRASERKVQELMICRCSCIPPGEALSPAAVLGMARQSVAPLDASLSFFSIPPAALRDPRSIVFFRSAFTSRPPLAFTTVRTANPSRRADGRHDRLQTAIEISRCSSNAAHCALVGRDGVARCPSSSSSPGRCSTTSPTRATFRGCRQIA